jgi:hypothetical protein
LPPWLPWPPRSAPVTGRSDLRLPRHQNQQRALAWLPGMVNAEQRGVRQTEAGGSVLTTSRAHPAALLLWPQSSAIKACGQPRRLKGAASGGA